MKNAKRQSRRRIQRTVEQLHLMIEEQSTLAQIELNDLTTRDQQARNAVTKLKDPLSVLMINLDILSDQIQVIYPILCEVEEQIIKGKKNPGAAMNQILKRYSHFETKKWRMEFLELLFDSIESIRVMTTDVGKISTDASNSRRA
jgi:hypothetical protein